jgi:hypothetical protein
MLPVGPQALLPSPSPILNIKNCSEPSKWQCLSYCSHPCIKIQRSWSNQKISPCILGTEIARQPQTSMILPCSSAQNLWWQLWTCGLSCSGHSDFSGNWEQHGFGFLIISVYTAFHYSMEQKVSMFFSLQNSKIGGSPSLKLSWGSEKGFPSYWMDKLCISLQLQP